MQRRMLVGLAMAAAFGLAACGGSDDPVPTAATGGSAFGVSLNAIRADSGLAPLSHDARLDIAAGSHVADMAARGYFSHNSPDGGTLSSRVADTGYQACFAAENIAQGQLTEAEVLASWMGSSGHRQNILAQEAEGFGIGRSGDLWVLVLGASC